MSSSITLAYLPIRAAGQVQVRAESFDSSVHQLESRRSVSRSTDINAPLSDTENVTENENAQHPSSVARNTHVELKEGGYGWVVTGCSFTLMFLYAGTLYSWGIFQAELAQRQLASSLLLSTVGGLQAFCQAIGCMPASLLVSRIGQSWTAALGMGIAGISMIMASFSTGNIGGLVFLQGILFGTSGSLIYLTAYTAPSHWFSKRRGLTTGIASCGGGLGGAAFAIAAQRLLREWGMAWTYRFFGLLLFVVGVPVGLALRSKPVSGDPDLIARPDKHILRSSRFVRILLAVFIASYPFFIPPYYISQYAQSIGLSASQGALYSALFSLASAFGRVAFGVLADNLTGYINAWSISILTIALSSLTIWPQAINQPLIILFAILCGIGSGGFFALQSSVVAQVVGLHRLERGIGWLEIAASFGFLAGPISAGSLLDAFGGPTRGAQPYRPIIYLVGGTTALAWVLIASVRWSSSRKLWKKV